MNPPVLIILIVLVVAVLAGVLVFRRRKSSPSPESSQPILDTGAMGERYAKEALESLSGYKRFVSNCYIPKEDEYTEADLILLHQSGIYVIESKNFNGWIYGSEWDKNWTQSLAGGRTKTSFYNPIRQNKGHIKWLKQYLDLGEDIPCYSFIVFGDGCKLQKLRLTSGEHIVVNCRDLLQAVQKNAKAAGQILSRQQIDTYYQRLDRLAQRTDEEKARHVETVQRKKAEAEAARQKKSTPPAKPVTAAKAVQPVPKASPKQEERICPRCGGKLVLRTAGKGEHVGEQFWGCSNFTNNPRCWYREYIDETVSTH